MTKIKLNNYDKIVLKNILGAFIVKGVSLLISFFSLPIYIKYFNDDIILGLWFTLLSLLSWLLTFDFGIGNGLRNKLVSALSENNKELAKTYISSSYYLLAIIVSIFTVIVTPILFFINWNNLLNVDVNIINKKVLLIVVLINYFTIILQFFFRLITFIIYALQKSAVNNFINLITTLFQLIFVLIYKGNSNESNLIILSIVHLICVVFPLIVVTIYIFNKHLKFEKPKLRYFKPKIGLDILSLGARFFWIQLMFLLLTSSNSFFMTQLFDPSVVVEYQKYHKIFSLASMIFSLALTPFWSTVTKAKVENNWKWIKKSLKLLSLSILMVFVFQLIITFMLQFIFNIWLGDASIKVNKVYALVNAIFGVVYISVAVLSTFANGFNKLNTQAVIFTIGSLYKIILIIFFSDYIKNWSYIIIVDIIIFASYSIIEYFVITKYINRNIKVT